MVGRRGLALITMLIAILALLGAPEVEARMHRHRRAASRPRRCHSDKQCHGGTCNDAGQCCRADEITCGTSCCNKLLADACCGGQCVDLHTSRDNCGWCGNVCLAGGDCVDGECLLPCGPCEERVNNVCVPKDGETDCNGVCVHTQTDPHNCGGCGAGCPSGITCTNGTCDFCGVGYTTCHPPDPNRVVGCCRQDIAP